MGMESFIKKNNKKEQRIINNSVSKINNEAEQVNIKKEDSIIRNIESIEDEQNLKNCLNVINGPEGELHREELILSRISKNADSFFNLSKEEKTKVKELLVEKIANTLSVKINPKLGKDIFENFTRLSETDKETIDNLSKKEKIDSETEEWDLELAKRNEKLVNLNLLSQEDRPLIIKRVFDNLRNESNQQQYSTFNNLEYLLKEEYTDYFKEDIKKYLEDYIDKIFSNAEEKIKNNENPQRLLEIKHMFLKEMISDGLKKIADPKKEIAPILKMIDEGLLKIEKLSTELDLKGIY
jgi:hypothetical protein